MIPSNEFNPYYQPYIILAGDGDLFSMLQNGQQATFLFFKHLPLDKQQFKYAPSKWTPKEILLHLIDTERVFCYRALHFSRENGVVLPGFDQDIFVQNSFADSRSMENLLQEYMAVRQATITLFDSFSSDTLQRIGQASGSPMSVRAIAAILFGHEKHHIQIIEEKYLSI